MIRINVEHFVAGSPLDERGDGTLSYTAGISQMAEQLAALFVDKLPTSHALLFALVNPDTNLMTIMHAQGDYTRFEGQGRAYNTRIVYELTRETHATKGLDRRLSPIIAALDKMHPYDSRVFGQPNELTIDETIGKAQLTPDEQTLHDVLVHAVVNNQQLFIRLGESDKLAGDNVRQSPKLQALLHAIDALPQGIRGYVSLGFSLIAETPVSQIMTDHLLVIAHHDDINNWGEAARAALQVDWQEAKPWLLQGKLATPTEQGRIKQVAPLIEPFLDTTKASRNTVMDMMRLIPENVDHVLQSKKSPTDNEVRIIQAVYDTDTPHTYRQQDAAEKLLQWMQNGIDCKVSIIDIWKKYPKLHESVLKVLRAIISISRSFLQLADTYNKYAQDIPDVTEMVTQRVRSSIPLMDDSARHLDEPLSRALQPAIAQKAKTWQLAEKLQRMDNPYFGLTIEDIRLDGWKSYVQLLDYSRKHGKLEWLEQLRPQVQTWDIAQLDATALSAVLQQLTEKEKKELNSKFLIRAEHLIGQPDELKKEINKLKSAGLTQTATQIEERLEKLNTQNLARDYDAVEKALGKVIDIKRLKNHTPQSLAAAIDTPEMSIGQYCKWLKLMVDKEQKLKHAELFQLFADANQQIEKKYAYGWLMDPQNSELIREELKKDPETINNLLKYLSKEEREEFKERYALQMPRPWVKELTDHLKKMDKRIIASVAAAVVLAIGLTLALKLRTSVGPDLPAPVPVPAYMHIQAKLSSDTIQHQDSYELQDRHFMSLLSQWYLDALFKKTACLEVFSMRLTSDSINNNQVSLVTTDNLNAKQLWLIDSIYYQAVASIANDSIFASVQLITSDDTPLPIDRYAPLLKVANDGEQHMVKKVMINSVDMDIDNNIFLQRNHKQRYLSDPVYLLWLVQQIDSCRRVNQITQLFPY